MLGDSKERKSKPLNCEIVIFTSNDGRKDWFVCIGKYENIPSFLNYNVEFSQTKLATFIVRRVTNGPSSNRRQVSHPYHVSLFLDGVHESLRRHFSISLCSQQLYTIIQFNFSPITRSCFFYL